MAAAVLCSLSSFLSSSAIHNTSATKTPQAITLVNLNVKLNTSEVMAEVSCAAVSCEVLNVTSGRWFRPCFISQVEWN